MHTETFRSAWTYFQPLAHSFYK